MIVVGVMMEYILMLNLTREEYGEQRKERPINTESKWES